MFHLKNNTNLHPLLILLCTQLSRMHRWRWRRDIVPSLTDEPALVSRTGNLTHFSTLAEQPWTAEHRHTSQQHPGAHASQPGVLTCTVILASSQEVPSIASRGFDDLQTRRLDLLAPYQLTNDFDKFSSLIFFFLLRECLDSYCSALFIYQLKQEAITINYHVRLATVL